jgi:hypothetical protein
MLNRGSIGSSSYEPESEVGVATNDDSIGNVTFDTLVNDTNTNLNSKIQPILSSGNSCSAFNVMGSSAVQFIKWSIGTTKNNYRWCRTR